MAILPLTRLGAQKISTYLDQIQERDYSKPDDDTMRHIASLVNQSTAKCFQETDRFLQGRPEIKRGVRALKAAPRLRGSAEDAEIHLKRFTPYEQMSIVRQWVDTTDFSKEKRTLSLYHENGSIPLTLSPPPKSKLDLYPVFIGNSSGALKGPSYTEWQEKDPVGTDREIFIDHLDALESHRTGCGDGALLLKKGAYESDRIDHTWRYAVFEEDGSAAPEASVELPRQKQPKAARARAFAPGYNLTEMVSRRTVRNQNILPERLYETFCDDGYEDEAVPVVTPMKMVKSLHSAIRGDTEELDSLVAKLSATHLAVSSHPVIKQFTARRLGFTE